MVAFLKSTNVNGIPVEYESAIEIELVKEIALEEIAAWKSKGNVLTKILITIDPEDNEQMLVKAFPLIRRVRRITGYLSDKDNFNEAKQDELSQRYQHIRSGCRCD